MLSCRPDSRQRSSPRLHSVAADSPGAGGCPPAVRPAGLMHDQGFLSEPIRPLRKATGHGSSEWRARGSLRAAPKPVVTLWVNGDMVVDLGDPRRPPGGTLGFLALCPGAYAAPEYYFAAMRLDSNSVSIDFGAAPKGLLDLRLDFRWCNGGLEEDQIADPFDAADTAHGLLGANALVVPFRRALEG